LRERRSEGVAVPLGENWAFKSFESKDVLSSVPKLWFGFFLSQFFLKKYIITYISRELDKFEQMF